MKAVAINREPIEWPWSEDEDAPLLRGAEFLSGHSFKKACEKMSYGKDDEEFQPGYGDNNEEMATIAGMVSLLAAFLANQFMEVDYSSMPGQERR